MAQAQRNERPYLQHFQTWISRQHARGLGSNLSLDNNLDDFTPDGAVHEYLKSESRCKGIIGELSDPENLPVKTKVLLEKYSKVFAVLVRIGKGHYIPHFLENEELGDHQLPFSKRPAAFPSEAQDFFDDFYREQFRFCAAVFDGRAHHAFVPERIMPYLEKEEIGQGGSSVVYKVKVHGRHVSGQEFRDNSASPGEARHYALKEYIGKHALQLHNFERSAFARFGNTGIEDRHMVRFLCSYSHRNRYYTLLEFADLGTLENFMEQQPSPRSGEEVLMFWSRFLPIVEAIVNMHDIQDHEHLGTVGGYAQSTSLKWSASLTIFRSICHQDIKPGNILVKSRPGATDLFDCAFGLADFGSSRYRSSSSLTQAVDSFATATYGAPETARQNRFEDSRRIAVATSVDIWSIAAVLSEVSVWVMFGKFGPHGVDGYRERRQYATGRHTRGPDCFHLNDQLLGAVQDEHIKIMGYKRCDSITTGVLRLMPYILHPEPKQRLTALQLHRRLKDLVEDAHRACESPLPLATLPGPPQARQQLAQRQTSPTSTIIGRHRNRTSSSHRSIELVDNALGSDDSRDAPFVASPKTTLTYAEPGNGSDAAATALADHVATAFGEMFIESGRSMTAGPSRNRRPPTADPVVNQESSVSAHRRTFDRSSRDASSQTTPNHHHTNSIAFPTSRPALAPASPTGELKRFSVQEIPRQGTIPIADPMSQVPYAVPTPSPHNTSMPGQIFAPPSKLNFTTAERWRTQSKLDHHRPRPPSGIKCLEQLEGYDIVFVVDDSATMGEIRKAQRDGVSDAPNVKTLSRLLCWLAKEKDEDGVDLLYFHEPALGLRNCKKSREVFENISQRTFEGNTTPTVRVQKVLNEYKANLEAYRRRLSQPHRSMVRRLNPFSSSEPEPPKPLSVYVLTDGVWEDDQTLGHLYVDDTIASLVKELVACGLPKNHVGVQFISFGNHRFGLQRLEALDHLAATQHLPRDIVDTEPADGDIYKMLLGAINDRYDRVNEAPRPAVT